MKDLAEKIALVTGASGGIGSEVTRSLVNLGITVIGAALHMEKLELLYKSLSPAEQERLILYNVDLTDQAMIDKMFKDIADKCTGIDICVNCAGDISQTSLMKGTYKDWKRLMNLHLISRLHICKLTVKSIRDRQLNDGHIFNISSCANKTVFLEPFTHFYSCTQFAMHAACEGLRQEIREKNIPIKVTEVTLGLTRTPMVTRMPFEPQSGKYDELQALYSEDVALSITQYLKLEEWVDINELSIRPSNEQPQEAPSFFS